MATGYVIRKNQYFDSVFLMQVAQNLSKEPGIQQAAALMGTERNKQLLADMGFDAEEIASATPNDLIIALQGKDASIVNAILNNVGDWLVRRPTRVSKVVLRTLTEALAHQSQSNLVAISVPGNYAASEAYKALEQGLNVFLFSSNVSAEDELALKERAQEQGLIVMGPDCGTAIIAGTGIGFANAVRSGPIGVIGASGTGLQEFTSLVHRAGSGISHAIGTGSRDLSDDIGGITTFQALAALERDSSTEVIALVSKPPGERTLKHLVIRLNQCRKPIIACLLGVHQYPSDEGALFTTARTMDEAAALAIQMITDKAFVTPGPDPEQLEALISNERAGMAPEQKYIRGIFAGGTFCYQAQQVMRDSNLLIFSNAPLDGMLALADPLRSEEHTLIDMGADTFTQGRPHPMIDSTLRCERILAEAEDPQVAIVLLDFILGHNAASDPVGDLLEAIVDAKGIASQRGGFLSVVASVCGTEDDPQNSRAQARALEEVGVLVLPSSAQAALFSRELAMNL